MNEPRVSRASVSASRDRVALRLGMFAAGLVVVFVLALFVGRAVGPLDSGSDAPAERPTSSTVVTTMTLHEH